LIEVLSCRDFDRIFLHPKFRSGQKDSIFLTIRTEISSEKTLSSGIPSCPMRRLLDRVDFGKAV
jgi:hypothetical protein